MESSSPTIGADAQPTITTTKFTLFPKLPNEIQDMVWKEAISSISPRIIELAYSPTTKTLTSPTLPPSLLHTTSRSRHLTLRHYTPLSFTTFTRTYISWSLDTLFFHLPTNTALFAQQLADDDCTEMYQNCQRIIINPANSTATPTRSVLEFGDITRRDEEWVEHPTNPDSGRYVEDELFGYFEGLVEVGVARLGGILDGSGSEGGDLRVVMGSDDGVVVSGDSAFPSRRLLDQCVCTVKSIRVVELARVSERRMSEGEKRERAVREFEEGMEVLDREWEEAFEVEGVDEIWEGEIERWVEGIPEGPISWPEDWARALGEF